MNDYSDLISSYGSATQSNLANSLDDNPDDAAKAQDLSNQTGVPGRAILNDLDEFEARHRSTLASNIVMNNPKLREYVNSHPLAASISNDDWGNLDEFSQNAQGTSYLMRALNWNPLRPVVAGGLKGVVEGFQEGFGGESTDEEKKLFDPMQSPLGIAGAGVAKLFDTQMRTLSGVMQGAIQGAQGAVTPVLGASAGREAGAMLEWSMMRGDAPMHPAEPWVREGKVPPRGVAPEIDKARVDLNKAALDSLDKDLQSAQASSTKERSPEMFQNLAKQHYENATIGIHGDAVAALYGDKVPAADDNILGWVPGIENQLALAKETGADVHIPVADWVSKVDPEIAKILHDDIRMWPDGITARESREEIPPKITTDSPLAQTRAANSLEPLFSNGDRKLQLVMDKIGQATGPEDMAGKMDDLQILDENGKPVGQMRVGRGDDKELLIDWVGGQAGMWANSFGPSLIRDLKRQLKALYPDYDYLTGWRVSGAREAAGAADELRVPRVKLDVDPTVDDYAPTRSIFNDSWQRFGDKLLGNVQPTDMLLAHEREMGEAVHDEIRRIAGDQVETQPTTGIAKEGSSQAIRGAYIPYQDRAPTILYDLTGPDPLGVGRHEAIHFLRGYGFFKPEEWETLSQAAQSEGWLDRYGIHDRYSNLDSEGKTEEAIAEAYREWAGAKDRPDTPIGRIFQKIQDFLDRIKDRFKEIFGHVPTAEELFQKTDRGDVGARGPGEPLHSEAFKLSRQRSPLTPEQIRRIADRAEGKTPTEPPVTVLATSKAVQNKWRPREGYPGQFLNPTWDEGDTIRSKWIDQNGNLIPQYPGELTTVEIAERFGPMKFSTEDPFDNFRANAAGLDLDSFRKIQKQILDRHQEDVEASIARAQKEQARRQTKEWKDNHAEIAKEVEATIRQRPDVAADLFIGSGELYGKKLQQRFTLKASDLSDQQKAALPNHYVSTNGLPVDEVARMFGYGSGDAMVEKLSAYNAAKGDLSPQEALRQTIETETNRQMEARFGSLGQNILDEAQDQALSENNLNILAEEMHAAGLQAGTAVIDKDVAKAWAKDQFAKLPIGSIKSERFMADLARHGRDAERALIGGDPATALVSMQKKYLSALLAKEATTLEKETVAFDKEAKRLSKRQIDSIDPEYTNHIHSILMQIGKPVRRSVDDLGKAIEAQPYKNLQDFVDTKQAMLREVPVWDQLFDKTWQKPYQSLSAEEFRAVRDSIKTLAWNGRDELKIEKAGEAADWGEVKKQMIAQLQEFGTIDYTKPGGQRGGLQLPRTVLASHLQLENIFNRWDEFDRHGVWNQYGIRGMIEGANDADALKKEFARRLRETDDGESLKRTVDNTIFRQPDDQGNPTGPPIQFTRANLRSVMLNLGNGFGHKSNLAKLAKGYGLEPQAVIDWVHSHATKADWDWTQKIWDIFADVKNRSDTMYRSMTGGVAAEDIPVRPVETPFGTYKGGYYPVIYHETFEGRSKRLLGSDPLEQENYVRAATPAGYTKSRTGYFAPMSLDIDQMPNRISQMLHDIAMRPAIVQASKVFYDADIRRAITNHIGKEYSDLLVPYIRDVANVSNFMSKSQVEMESWSGFFRQNLISTLVGFNPGTVMKHFPTAGVLSIKEVGPQRFLDAVKSLYSINPDTGESNYAFAMKWSQELQRRDRNAVETLYGATGELQQGSQLNSLRQKIIQYGAMPVAFSDKISAVPTWLAAYRQAMEGGETHGDSIYAADRAVRRAHGSTSITNRTQIMRTASPWLTSVYNFFSDVMNRQMETLWKSGETMKLAKEGQWSAASKTVPGLAAGLFAYAIWPAIVEQWVSPVSSDPNESWALKSAKVMARGLSSSWVGVRDVANFLLEGREPSVGLISTGLGEIANAVNDLKKQDAFGQEHAGKMIKDGFSLAGLLTGVPGGQIGRVGQYLHDVRAGIENPRGPWSWLTGLRYGTTKHHSTTWDNYLRSHPW